MEQLLGTHPHLALIRVLVREHGAEDGRPRRQHRAMRADLPEMGIR